MNTFPHYRWFLFWDSAMRYTQAKRQEGFAATMHKCRYIGYRTIVNLPNN